MLDWVCPNGVAQTGTSALRTERCASCNTGYLLDTISQRCLAIQDTDGDGTPNHEDDDDDNDTVLDVDDVDDDNDGLIEIHSIDMLHNIRNNLDGTSYAGDSTGAPTTEPENCNDDNTNTTRALCGYELTRSLDFAMEPSYADTSMLWSEQRFRPLDSTEPSSTSQVVAPDQAQNAGWEPIGHYTSSSDNAPFTAILDGNGHVIRNLYARRTEELDRSFWPCRWS